MDRSKLLANGTLLLLTAAVGLAMALNRHDTLVLGGIGVLGTILIPLSHVLLRRFLRSRRQHETEDRMISQTREYLRNQEPWSPLRDASAESDSEAVSHANASGSRIAPRGFKDVLAGVVAPLPNGNPVACGALTLHYAAGAYGERRAADLSATVPALVTVPLSELLPEDGCRAGVRGVAGRGKGAGIRATLESQRM